MSEKNIWGGCPDPVQDYKSLRPAVMTWATLVNTQTDRAIDQLYMTSSVPANQ